MLDAIFDYMSLLDIPYDLLFKCRCGLTSEQKLRMVGIYDNACGWLRYTCIRFPSLVQQILPYIDALHHSGHKNCSPAFNTKFNAITSANKINVALNEQKNRIINYMKSSASMMGIIRLMEYVLYHLACLNLIQIGTKALIDEIQGRSAAPAAGIALPLQTYVFDGVRVGCKKRSCYIDRPHEIPHDKLDQQSPSALFVGSTVDKTVMICNPDVRATLSKLISCKAKDSPTFEDVSELNTWMSANRPALKVYIDTVFSSTSETTGAADKVMYCLKKDENTELILPLVSHWASPSPEIIIIPVVIMLTVCDIVATKKVTPSQNSEISTYSEGLRRLIHHDKKANSGRGAQHSSEDVLAVTISDTLVNLLKEMLSVARSCLAGDAGSHTTAPWPVQSPNLGEDGDVSECAEGWEHMIRTGSYFPHHPIFRRLQYCKHDYCNEKTAERKKGKLIHQGKEVLQDLQYQIKRMGLTCNKYKEKSSKLTPGLFTVFCACCSVCVGFEVMDNPESPATAFKVFTHRAWTVSDFETREKWLKHGCWEDTVTVLPSYAKNN